MTAGDKVLRLSGLRGMIAGKMRDSLQSTAQLSYFADCDAEALVAARGRLREAGLKVGYEDLVIAALARLLPRHPLLNGRLEGQEIQLSAAVHVSLAIALPGGLVAPALFDVAGLDLAAIAAARAALTERARAGKLTPCEMTGGTITLSNLGTTRVRHFTPILNRPQIALVGLGCIAPRPWVLADGSLGVRRVLGLSLTADHQVVDGQPAGAFLSDLCALLEDPESFA